MICPDVKNFGSFHILTHWVINIIYINNNIPQQTEVVVIPLLDPR